MLFLAILYSLGCVTNCPDCVTQADLDAAVTQALEAKGCLTEEDAAGFVSNEELGTIEGRVGAIEADYLTEAEAALTYLTPEEAAETYLTVEAGESYLTAGDLLDHETRISELENAGFTTESWVVGEGYASQSQVVTLEGRVDVLDATAAAHEELFAYVSVDAATDSVVFSGANVYVQNGDGSTGTTNALGNLIIGYNADDGASARSGSHNLVVGDAHNWLSYGGVLFGYDNATFEPYSLVLGGVNNEVQTGGEYAVIVGGYANRATGEYSAVFGGESNAVSGAYATMVGGYGNNATDQWSLAAGGALNIAGSSYTVVAGGYQNEALASYSGTFGGWANNATGYASFLLGGQENTAEAGYAAVTGGYQNAARGLNCSVTGGVSESCESTYDIGPNISEGYQ